MNQNIYDLKLVSSSLRAAQQKAYDAKIEACRIKDERNAMRADAIGAMFDEFVVDMQQARERVRYERRGNYTSEFTRYVSRRSYKYSIALSNEHGAAIDAYNQAAENLKKEFVNAVLADPERCKQILMSRAGLKNLNENKRRD